jgi:hypothetical protein
MYLHLKLKGWHHVIGITRQQHRTCARCMKK